VGTRPFLLLALTLNPLLADPGFPFYTPDSIANSAANVAGFYAPNSFISIYGVNLAYVTKPISTDDIRDGQLPTALAGTGVRVLIIPGSAQGGIFADIYYVSPGQVNALIPSSLIPGPAIVQLINNGLAGPPVTITLSASAPVLFQAEGATVIATHGNGPFVTMTQPAQGGEVVVLYATGLGATLPAAIPNQIPPSAAWIVDRADFRVVLNGKDVDSANIQYAGVTPGFAGLFQINLLLPADAPPNPQIQIGYGDQLSPAGLTLPLQ
jgi:uncharacterized protein (TIGR03437 family)